MEQPQYNMLHRDRFENEYARLYDEIGLGTTTWSPLASGFLTGKYNDGIPADSRGGLEGYEWLRSRFVGDEASANIVKIKQLEPIAEQLECTLAQLAIAWCLKNPHVSSVITGASRPEQVVENMRAMEVFEKLDDGLMERIEGILDNRPAPEQDWKG